MIQNLIFVILFFGNILGIQLFYIRPHVPVEISSKLKNSYNFKHQYSVSNMALVGMAQWAFQNFKQKVSKPTKNKISLFLKYSSLTLQTSIHFTLKIICSCNTVKILSHFTNFGANIFLFAVRKKHLHCTICLRPRMYPRNISKANVWLFLYICVRKFLFQRRSKILSGWVGRGGDGEAE